MLADGPCQRVNCRQFRNGGLVGILPIAEHARELVSNKRRFHGADDGNCQSLGAETTLVKSDNVLAADSADSFRVAVIWPGIRMLAKDDFVEGHRCHIAG